MGHLAPNCPFFLRSGFARATRIRSKILQFSQGAISGVPLQPQH
jgi:hypothetical protein